MTSVYDVLLEINATLDEDAVDVLLPGLLSRLQEKPECLCPLVYEFVKGGWTRVSERIVEYMTRYKPYELEVVDEDCNAAPKGGYPVHRTTDTTKLTVVPCSPGYWNWGATIKLAMETKQWEFLKWAYKAGVENSSYIEELASEAQCTEWFLNASDVYTKTQYCTKKEVWHLAHDAQLLDPDHPCTKALWSLYFNHEDTNSP